MKHLTIAQLTKLIMDQAEEKGFGTKPEEVNVAEKITLIHSELSEAYEAYRHKNIDDRHGFKEELADTLQRTIHLCGVFDIDIEKIILNKLTINKSREWDWSKMNEGIIQSTKKR